VVFIEDTTAKHNTAFWLGFCVNIYRLKHCFLAGTAFWLGFLEKLSELLCFGFVRQ